MSLITNVNLFIYSSSVDKLYYVVDVDGNEYEVVVIPSKNPYITIDDYRISIVYRDKLEDLLGGKACVTLSTTPALITQYDKYPLEVIDPTNNTPSRIVFTTYHIFILCRDTSYELYYDVNTNVLIYANIVNTLTGEEIEIRIKFKPGKQLSLESIMQTTNSATEKTTNKNVNSQLSSTGEKQVFTSYTSILVVSIALAVIVLALFIWRRLR